jgi:hypothetical protein
VTALCGSPRCIGALLQTPGDNSSLLHALHGRALSAGWQWPGDRRLATARMGLKCGKPLSMNA